MQVPEEIEDPEGYCMLKIEKIDAVHGSLRQSVQMGHMKPDRAEIRRSSRGSTHEVRDPEEAGWREIRAGV